MKSGCLHIVSVPIGNDGDITLRALNVLREADAIICEEYRQGSTLLKRLNLPAKELLLLNEHNEQEANQQIVELLISGMDLALISDCGTPGFADPGTSLIKLANENHVPVKPVPGASALMAVIAISPMPLDEFYFAGFLPRKTDQRKTKLEALQKLKVPIILMDTPYRLKKLLAEIRQIFGKNRRVTLGFDLTLPTEKIAHGMVEDILRQVGERKGEFMLIVH